MRQLTGLDAQFLAMETPRQTGHVSMLAVLDPSTRPSGQLELEDVQRAGRGAPAAAAAVAVAAAPGPVRARLPVLDRRSRLRSRVPRARAGAAASADRREARRAGGADRFPAARSRAAVVGALPDPRARARSRRAADQDPSRRRRRDVRGRDPRRADGHLARRAASAPPRGERRDGGRRASSRCSFAGCSDRRGTSCGASRALPRGLPNLDETRAFGTCPAPTTLARPRERLRARSRPARGRRSSSATPLKPPRTSFNGRVSPHRRFAFGQLSLQRRRRSRISTGARSTTSSWRSARARSAAG